MKVNIILFDDPKQGYLNLCPINRPPVNGVNIIYCPDMANISDYVDDAEATEIVAEDIINYVAFDLVGSVVQHWYSKLRHGGVMVIGSTELDSIAHSLTHGELTSADALTLLYGNSQKQRLSSFRLDDVLALVNLPELELIKKTLNAYMCTVVVRRR